MMRWKGVKSVGQELKAQVRRYGGVIGVEGETEAHP